LADTLVKTVGFFWREGDVFWGRPRNPGTLLGKPRSSKKSDPIDFRDQAGVYVLYADYRMVYVGQTGRGSQNLFARLRQHRSDDLAGRWNQFSWFGVRGVLKNGGLSNKNARFHPSLEIMLDHVEGVLIHSSEPPRNAQKGRFGAAVKRFLQVRDERLGPEEGRVLAEIHDKLGAGDHAG
jgi:hypothetical protein